MLKFAVQRKREKEREERENANNASVQDPTVISIIGAKPSTGILHNNNNKFKRNGVFRGNCGKKRVTFLEPDVLREDGQSHDQPQSEVPQTVIEVEVHAVDETNEDQLGDEKRDVKRASPDIILCHEKQLLSSSCVETVDCVDYVTVDDVTVDDVTADVTGAVLEESLLSAPEEFASCDHEENVDGEPLVLESSLPVSCSVTPSGGDLDAEVNWSRLPETESGQCGSETTEDDNVVSEAAKTETAYQRKGNVGKMVAHFQEQISSKTSNSADRHISNCDDLDLHLDLAKKLPADKMATSAWRQFVPADHSLPVIHENGNPDSDISSLSHVSNSSTNCSDDVTYTARSKNDGHFSAQHARTSQCLQELTGIENIRAFRPCRVSSFRDSGLGSVSDDNSLPGSLEDRGHDVTSSSDKTYILESQQDSSSGIASDDHNAFSGASETSPIPTSVSDRWRNPKPFSYQQNQKILQNQQHDRQHMEQYYPQGFLRETDSTQPGYYTGPQHQRPLQYQETDLDDPYSGFAGRQGCGHPQHNVGYPLEPVCVTKQELMYYERNGFCRSPSLTEDTGGVLLRKDPHPHKKTAISYFDILPDDVLIRIFGGLSSDQLCRCARVCRRWYSVVWDHSLWTCIRINNSEINVDKALKLLTKRLSYDTPTVCVMVERINLNGCERLTDKGLYTLARRCPELRHLEVQRCPGITNIAMFEIVSRCINLEHLSVAGCANITCICLTPEATVQSGTYGKQVDLRYLDMTDCYNLDDSGLQIIASYCPLLTHLYLRRCVRVTDIGVQYVANYCTHLREFSISDCSSVTDFGLRELSKLESNLRYLSIAKCDKISDLGVKYVVRSCHKIRYLNLRGCEAVSDESVEMIARYCSRLKSLDVGKCDISDEGLQSIAEYCQHLKKLSLKACDGITDRGLIMLAYRTPKLQQLNIQECHLTVQAYKTVKKYCKHCIIEHTNPAFY